MGKASPLAQLGGRGGQARAGVAKADAAAAAQRAVRSEGWRAAITKLRAAESVPPPTAPRDAAAVIAGRCSPPRTRSCWPARRLVAWRVRHSRRWAMGWRRATTLGAVACARKGAAGERVRKREHGWVLKNARTGCAVGASTQPWLRARGSRVACRPAHLGVSGGLEPREHSKQCWHPVALLSLPTGSGAACEPLSGGRLA